MLTNAVITWTTEYYQIAVQDLRARGRAVPDEILAHISPAHSENINFFGVITVDVEAERGPSPWAAPFSATAASRLRRTIRFAGGLSLPNLARAVAAVLLVLVLLFTPFRTGMQITSGLDPNATINAWGGPTYLGAMLAHYLDGTVGFYAAAFLLSRLLLPAAAADCSASHGHRQQKA